MRLTSLTLTSNNSRFSQSHKANFCFTGLLAFFSLLPQIGLGQTELDLSLLVFDPVIVQNDSTEPDSLTTSFILSNPDENSLPSIIKVEETDVPTSKDEASNVKVVFTDTEVIQQELDTALEHAISQYQQSILTLELDGGPYEERLGQELIALGMTYQQQNNHLQALDTFDQALHINRLNNGLFNLSQIPIVEEIIRSHLANGDLKAADAQQEYLLYLQRKVHGANSPELIPALQNYANWNILAFSIPLGIVSSEGFSSIAYAYSAANFSDSAEFQDFLLHRLVNAQSVYSLINFILRSNFDLNDSRIPEVEQNLALTSYFYATNYNETYNSYETTRVIESSMGYPLGRGALRRRIDYLQNMEDTSPEELSTAMIELGDWNLVFGKANSARKLYQEANQILLDSETQKDLINESLHSAIPISIPTFLTQRYSRAANGLPQEIELNYKGYIDVEFTISRYGRINSVNVLDKAEGTSPLIESRLISRLRESRYRARMIEGKFIKNDPYKIRYYYTY